MLVDDKLAKEKLISELKKWGDAKVVKWQDSELAESAKVSAWDALQCAQLIRNTDLTDCQLPMDAQELAKLFHDTYERLAPTFGYTTRKETKEWNPYSTNAQLMVAVCKEISGLIAPAPDQGSVRDATDELDAKRYRWLRDATSDVCEDSGITLICNSSMFGTRGLEGAEWDAAIDAAIRALSVLEDQKD